MPKCFICQADKPNTRPIRGRAQVGWDWEQQVCEDCLTQINPPFLQGPFGYDGCMALFRTEFRSIWFTDEEREYVRAYWYRVSTPSTLGKLLFKAVIAAQAKLPAKQQKNHLSVQTKRIAASHEDYAFALYRNGEWYRDAEPFDKFDMLGQRLQLGAMYYAFKAQGYLG